MILSRGKEGLVYKGWVMDEVKWKRCIEKFQEISRHSRSSVNHEALSEANLKTPVLALTFPIKLEMTQLSKLYFVFSVKNSASSVVKNKIKT